MTEYRVTMMYVRNGRDFRTSRNVYAGSELRARTEAAGTVSYDVPDAKNIRVTKVSVKG